MAKELNETDENGRCVDCRSRSITHSTEKRGNVWVWKKLCKYCNNELERQTVKSL